MFLAHLWFAPNSDRRIRETAGSTSCRPECFAHHESVFVFFPDLFVPSGLYVCLLLSFYLSLFVAFCLFHFTWS